ncbi:MAG TPA: glycosyltransferase [Solirubrobacteraceae bacterium]|nr:glycosyltransferase [Solirubrobacteraceae bacterium]
MPPPASIVIPTRARPDYLRVALESIAEQARGAGAEIVVVDDAGASAQARELAAAFGAGYEPHAEPLGLNVARNTGVQRSHGDLVVFVDDDVRARPGWLEALLKAAGEHPQVDVFAGQISARLEGPAPRGCGRERPPITTLELGGEDTQASFAWGANMAIRRSALERVGPFDVTLEDGGDEQEWQERLRAGSPGASVLYVADARVEHRRAGEDARLRSLARAAYVRGRAARRFDARRGVAPPLARELATLAGCVGHVLRRRCPAGLTMVAHSAARVREASRERARSHAHERARGGLRAVSAAGGERLAPAGAEAGSRPREDFLSGASGTVGGLDGVLRGACDAALDAWALASGERVRLALAARHSPPLQRVLVLAVQRPEHRRLSRAADAELLRSRHHVELHATAPGGRGKFENLNLLLRAHPPAEHDWLLVLDDDVELPRGFLDRFLFLCQRFSLVLAQPAHRLRSHAAWSVTRRRARSVVRETAFVEIGPVTAFARPTFPVLLPFPELSMGWGLDTHWAALAREHGWRCGVVDALAIRHLAAPAADAYRREDAIAEARAFLHGRSHVSASEAERTLTTHRSW